MKQKIWSILLAGAMLTGLAACGGGGDDPAGSASPAGSTAPTESAASAESATPSAASKESAAPAGSASPGSTAAEDLNVGVFYYNYGDTYIASVRTALDSALEAKGIKYTDYDGNNTQGTQNDQINTALTNGANLLIVNLVTSGAPDAAKSIIDMAGDVPVIFFNRAVDSEEAPDATLKSNENICFIGTDAPEAGHLQGQMVGEYLLEHYDDVDLNGDGTIQYAMFKGDEANVEAIYRTQYGQEDADAILVAGGKPAMEYFDAKNSSKYQVDQTGSWSAQAAVDYMNTNLAQYNEGNKNMIEVIICNNDNMAEGCISALNAAGYNDGSGKTIPVFGVDATDSAKELIADGKMTGTVKQDAEGMANAIAEAANAIAGGSSTTEAISTAAGMDDEMYTIAEGVDNKLYVAYAPFMKE